MTYQQLTLMNFLFKDIKMISLYPVRTEWTHADLPVVFFKISLDGSGGK